MLSNLTTRHSRPVMPEVDLKDTSKISRKWPRKGVTSIVESTRIERLVTVDVDPSYRKSICKILRKYSASSYKRGSSFANRLPVRRIDFTDDESCRPVRIVSIRQHSMPLFNALGRKKVHFNIDNILTMDFRPFHALRTWKVHVVIFSFHTTHFQTLLTPLDFWYVDARLDFRYTMLLIFTHCLPPSTSSMLTHDSTSGVLIRQRP